MEILGLALMVIGAIISVVFGIQILILAFRESILWGLGSLLIPLVGLIFIIMHWSETKKPFLYSLTAIPLFVLGGMLAGVEDKALPAPSLSDPAVPAAN